MTSEDKTVLYDPHDYDEVPMDEARSPAPLPPSPSAFSAPAGPGKLPTPTTPTLRPLPPDPDAAYSQVCWLVGLWLARFPVAVNPPLAEKFREL